MHIMPQRWTTSASPLAAGRSRFRYYTRQARLLLAGSGFQFKPGRITADGEVISEATLELPHNYMTEPHAFSARVLTVLPRNA